MSEARPPSLRGTDRTVFLIGAAVILVLQVYALKRVPAPASESPPAATSAPIGVPAATSAPVSVPVSLVGTPDPAGILWFTLTADGLRPARAVVRRDESVQIRLRSTSPQPRTFRLRPEAGGQMLETWAPVSDGAEVGQSVTLPGGVFVLEDGDQSAIIEAR